MLQFEDTKSVATIGLQPTTSFVPSSPGVVAPTAIVASSLVPAATMTVHA